MNKLSLNKKILMFVLAFIAALCFALPFALNSSHTAKADTPANGSTAGYSTFYMEEGAYIRIDTDGSGKYGIRWRTQFTKSWLDGLNMDTSQPVIFGTLVTTATLASNNIENLTLANFTSNNDTYHMKNIVAYTKTSGFSSQTNNFTASINYSKVNSENLQSSYGTELIARSYIKFTTNSTTTTDAETGVVTTIAAQEYTLYAYAADSQRSMRGVAAAAKAKGDNRVNDYLGTKSTAEISLTESALSATDSTVTLSENDGEYNTAYLGAKKVGTVDDATVTFDESVFALRGNTLNLVNSTTGAYAEVEFMPTISIGSLANFKAAINSDGDRDPAISYNYKLTANITTGGNSTDKVGMYNTLTGTFDGNGYTIAIKYSVTGNAALFNNIDGGTIKNLKVTGTFGSNTYGSGMVVNNVLENEDAASTIQNVYVEYTVVSGNVDAISSTYRSAFYAPIARIVYGTLELTDVVAYGTNASQPSNIGGLVASVGNNGQINATRTYSIAANTNIKPFNSNFKMSTVTGGIASKNGTLTTYNNGYKVYAGSTAKADFNAAVVDGAITFENSKMYSWVGKSNAAHLTQDNFTTVITDSGTLSGYYVLDEDISLSAIRGSTNTLTGTFDGNGHTITFTNAATAGADLFKYVNGGTIKNLKVVAALGKDSGAGILFGDLTNNTSSVTIENVYVEYTQSSTMASGKYAAPIGRLVRGTVNMTNVVTYGKTATQSGGIGGFFGIAAKDDDNPTTLNLTNCYCITENASVLPMSTGSTSATAIGANDANISMTTLLGAATTSGTKTTYANGLTAYTGMTSAYTALNNGDMLMSEKLRELVDFGVYYIGTKEELESYFKVNATFSGYYVLTADIDMGNAVYGNNTARILTGTLDGNGHTISGLKITSGNYVGGLFYGINGGTVKNLKVIGEFAGGSTNYRDGLIANEATGSVTLEDVYIEYTVANATIGASTATFRVLKTATVNLTNVVTYGKTATQPANVRALIAVAADSTANIKNCAAITTNTGLTVVAGTGDINYNTDEATDLKTYAGETAKTDFDTAVSDEDITLSDELSLLMGYSEEETPIELTNSNFTTVITTSGTLDGYYVLTEDIVLSSRLGDTNTLTGTLDGNGHTIDIAADVNNRKGGLFQNVDNGTIKNLTVIGKFGARTSSSTNGGGLLFYQNTTGTSVTLENVYVKYTYVKSGSDDGLYLTNPYFGAIAGIARGTITMTNVVIYGKNPDQSKYLGSMFGIVAADLKLKLTNCYCITESESPDPLVYNGTSTGTVHSGNRMVEVLGTPSRNADGSVTYGCGLTAYAGSTAKATFDEEVVSGGIALNGSIRDMFIAREISSSADFETYFGTTGTYAGNYVLTKDITLSKFYGTTAINARFAGTFDGNGHTISFTSISTSSAAGMFRTMSSGTVKNLNIKGTIRNANQAFIAYNTNSVAQYEIENVYVEYDGNYRVTTGNSSPLIAYLNGNKITCNNVVTYNTYISTAETSTAGCFFGIIAGAVTASNFNLTNCYAYVRQSGITPLTNNGNSASYKKTTDIETLFGSAETDGNVTTYANGLTIVLGDVNLKGYKILIPADAGNTSDIARAASDLHDLIYEATGIGVRIIREDDSTTYNANGQVISLGNTTYWEGAELDLDDINGYYGYVIKKVGLNYYINANYDRGVYNGVYRLLAEVFNYECFSDMVYTIDSYAYPCVPFPTEDIVFTTDSDTMAGMYTGSAFLDGDAKYAMGYIDRNSGVQGLNVPSSTKDPVSQQIPYNTYYSEHPDWYYIYEKDAETYSYWDWSSWRYVEVVETEAVHQPRQFCYTAHGNETEYNALVAKAAEVLEAQFMASPTLTAVHISMKDNKFWCDCDTCKAAKQAFGSDSATLIMFINDVAAEIDSWMEGEGSEYARYYEIQYLLYQRTIKPPYNAVDYSAGVATVKDLNTSLSATVNGTTYTYKVKDIIPAAHTLPIYASMRTNYHLSPNDTANAEFKKQIICWQAITNKGNVGFGVWSYFINLKNYIMFYDSFTYMSDWYKLYAQGGNTTWFYEEGTSSTSYNANASLGYGATAWTALRNYLSANLAKDTSLNQTTLTEKFFNAYYGAGASDMLTVYNATRTKFNDFRSSTAKLTFDVDANSSYAPSAGANGNTNYVNMGTNYEDAYPTYFDLTTLDWGYDFVKTALTNINTALTKVTDEQTIKNIKAERFAYEYMMIEICSSSYNSSDFDGMTLDQLKAQAKADATLNNIDNSVSGGSNGLKLADVWKAWGLA